MERPHFGLDRLRATDVVPPPNSGVARFEELLTVEDVAALLKVSKG